MTPALQPQDTVVLDPARDAMVMVPTGFTWQDVISPVSLLDQNSLTVVIVPTQRALQYQRFCLERLGPPQALFAALTSDTPPHQEREIWDRVAREKISLLLLTAKKIQSIQALSQLIRHPKLGPLILEQSHLVHPAWAVHSQAYEGLIPLFQEHWRAHPPLWVISHPMPQSEIPTLSAKLGLNQPVQIQSVQQWANTTLRVKRCITQYQKYKILHALLQENVDDMASQATLIICQHLKALLQLADRLPIPGLLAYHRQLSQEEREAVLLSMCHETQPVILLDSTLLAEFPSQWLTAAQLRVVHWQLPWSMEMLMQQTLLAPHAMRKSIDCTIFYTKEDLDTQKDWLKHRFSGMSPLKPIHLDQLCRLRHFCVFHGVCRRVTLETMLFGKQSDSTACNVCDVCQDPPDSSLWRKLARLFLY